MKYTYEIYIDVIFLINLMMNFIIIYISNIFIGKISSIKRMILASFITSLAYCMMVASEPMGKPSFLKMAALMIIAVWVGLKIKNIREMTAALIIMSCVSMLLGGMASAVFYYINGSGIIEMRLFNVGIRVMVISTAIVYIILKNAMKYYRRRIINRQQIVNITIRRNNQNAEVRALVDTGNSLSDNATGRGIIIAEFERIKSLLPEKARLMFYEKRENDLEEVIKNMQEIGFRIIPFNCLGKKNGRIIGFKADAAEIEYDGKTNLIKNVIIAVYNEKFTKNGEFNAIINPVLMEEEGQC